MIDQVRFSVVIPLYNKEVHIGRALDSVLGQLLRDFEVVVVDDGSTDSSAARVLEYSDQRLRLIRQKNEGVSAARNRGVAEALGTHIAFLDADDTWEPCHLEILNGLVERFPTAGAYGSAFRIIEANGNVINPTLVGMPAPPWEGIVPDYFKSVALGGPIINSSAVCVPKRIFQSAGGFVEGEKYGEDTSLWGRIALHFPIALSRKTGASYHRDASNRTCGSHRQEREWSFVAAAGEAMESGRLDGEARHYLRLYLDNSLMRMATDNVLAGNARFARGLLAKIHGRRHFRRKIAWTVLSRMPLRITKFLVKVAG